MTDYDLIIVGTGPGGLNAAVYAGRYMLKTLLIGELPGGMMGETDNICNFLSYNSINGMDLYFKMEAQVKRLGVEIKSEKVTGITKDKLFEVKTSTNTYSAKKLILATGSEKRKLGLEKEDEFLGRGVSYCAVCDAAFYSKKRVGIIGGGNSALKAALLISEYADKVYIIYRQKNFIRAEPAWVDSINKNDKIEVIFEEEVLKLKGEKFLTGIQLKNQELKVDGLFVEIGSEPASRLVVPLGVEIERKFVKTDREQKTNISGLFAAGDVTNNPLKQIITAASEGAIAANTAYKEIEMDKS